MKKRILQNPYMVFPLGVALVMVLLTGWAFTQGDREVINQPFLALLLLLPLLAAGYSVWVRKNESWLRRIKAWVGTTALGLAAAIFVFALSGMLIPVRRVPIADYNSRHFRFSDYVRAAQQKLVTAGDKAVDETLYTLDEQAVKLSDLWKQRPIVIEFGAVT